MKKFTAKKLAVLLLLAVVLSLGIIRWHSVDNLPFCHYSAGCATDADPKGNIKVTTYGYPLAYRQVEQFNPNNKNESAPNYAGYAESKVENPGFSLASLIADVVFWFALLHLLSMFIRPKAKAAGKMPAKPDDGRIPDGKVTDRTTPL